MSMSEILMCEFLKHLIRNNACKTAMIINGPQELTGVIILSCHQLSFYPTRNYFLSYGDLKRGRLYTTTGWTEAVPRNRSKAYPEAKIAPINKAVVTVWSSDANHIHYNFLNPGKPLHLRSVLRKLPRYLQLCYSLWQAPPPTRGTPFQKLDKLGCDVLTHLFQPPGLYPTDHTSSGI